jgi:AraC-like DNA-binding protein
MKIPRFIKISFPENKPFDFVRVTRPYFIVPWHFHPEIEIMLITRGTGTRFVGDSIENFEPLDLVMLGPNLAHVWKNNSRQFQEKNSEIAECVYIVFKEESFGSGFFSIPELKSVQDLILRSNRGLKFGEETQKKLYKLMFKALEEKAVDQLVSFLNILKILSETSDYEYLCSREYTQKVDAFDLHRLDSVLDYLLLNYRKEIKLDEVAGIANMSRNAFCRYFKDRTSKTVIQFLNEIRIEHAAQMLMDTQMNVEDIGAACGFKNVSNFYQQFQKSIGVSPSKFRKDGQDQRLKKELA